MPIANNMGDLQQMFRHQLQNAMQVVQSKVEADMFEEVGSFYTMGSPRIYPRTGNLGSSPRTTALSVGGDSVSFEAYLEPGSYDSVNAYLQSLGWESYFSPLQAFTAAENHTSHVRGKPGFWKRSQVKMEQELNDAMTSFFV